MFSKLLYPVLRRQQVINPVEEVRRPPVQSPTSTSEQEMELVPGHMLPICNGSKASSSVSVATDTGSARLGPVGADNSN